MVRKSKAALSAIATAFITGISKNCHYDIAHIRKTPMVYGLKYWRFHQMVVFRCALPLLLIYAVSPVFSEDFADVSPPRGFAGVEIGMSLDDVKGELRKDPQFAFRGDPDVSLLAKPNEVLIETAGLTFIERAYFQFYNGNLFSIILALNPEKIDHYSMYTTLVDRYGEPSSLDPSESVWEFDGIRLALERPLSVKYVDTLAFDEILRQNAQTESLNALSREMFLDQF